MAVVDFARTLVGDGNLKGYINYNKCDDVKRCCVQLGDLLEDTFVNYSPMYVYISKTKQGLLDLHVYVADYEGDTGYYTLSVLINPGKGQPSVHYDMDTKSPLILHTGGAWGYDESSYKERILSKGEACDKIRAKTLELVGLLSTSTHVKTLGVRNIGFPIGSGYFCEEGCCVYGCKASEESVVLDFILTSVGGIFTLSH